jgi:hypothetical protein
MSALPGVIGLMIFIYMRPHEFIPGLADYPFLYIFLFISIVGIAHDVSKRRTKLSIKPPTTRIVFIFLAWCAFTLGIRKPAELGSRMIVVIVDVILYLIIAHGIQSMKAFFRVVMVIFALGLFVAYVGADQGFRPFQCVIFNPAEKNSMGMADGRECAVVDADGLPHDGIADCIASGKPGMAYMCERAGLFGTTSVGGGRVRYLGVLVDPNELSLATALAVPFAFALFEMRATFLRLLLLLGTLGVVAVEIVFTQSRGGQLTFGGVLGAYFVKKYGIKRGAVAGACMVVPMLLLGGRHDEAAEESTLERLGCAAAGIKMLMSFPFTGVGFSQYLEYHFLTAHNAYILAAGELGLPGMWMFATLVYLSIKIPVTVLQHPMEETKENHFIKALAMGMLAAFCGGALGIYFLSWTYHYVLWIHFGLSGALYCSVKRVFPDYECKYTLKEARNITLGYIGYIIFWAFYIKRKGAWD